MGDLLKPNGRGIGVRALLEPRCGGTEGTEYRHIRFKSSAGYVLIVYAFMYALLIGYLLCSEVNVITYARTGALGGVEPTRGVLLLLISRRTFWVNGSHFLGGLSLYASDGSFYIRC